MHRLFVAIDLPESVRSRLGEMSCGVPGARWVDPSMMHLTLRFIGEVDSAVFGDIGNALDEVAFTPFPMALSGVGFFPPRGKPRVLWIGVEKNQALLQFQKRVESVLVRCGLEPEGRKFAPHITLARLNNSPPAKVGAFLSRNGLYMSERFQVDSFSLYSSVLGKNGVKHFEEARYPID